MFITSFSITGRSHVHTDSQTPRNIGAEIMLDPGSWVRRISLEICPSVETPLLLHCQLICMCQKRSIRFLLVIALQ